MNVTAVPLAELVNRGILAIHQKDEPAPATQPKPVATITPLREMRPPRSQSTNSVETAHILDSADRLIQRIKSLAVTSDDPKVLRKHILHGVESFLRDVTTKR